jgi:WD40 repeat protein
MSGSVQDRYVDYFSSSIFALSISPDGTQIVYGGDDQILVVRNISNTSNLNTSLRHDLHKSNIRAAIILPDGNTCISGSNAGEIFSWDLSSTERIREYPSTNPSVRAIKYDDVNKLVIVGDANGLIHIWNAITYERITTLIHHRSAGVRCLAISTDRNTLLSGGNDGQIVEWRLNDFARLSTYRLESNQFHLHVHDVAWIGSKHFISGSNDGFVRIWQANCEAPIARGTHYGVDIRTVAWLPATSMLLSGDKSGMVRFWNIPDSIKVD